MKTRNFLQQVVSDFFTYYIFEFFLVFVLLYLGGFDGYKLKPF